MHTNRYRSLTLGGGGHSRYTSQSGSGDVVLCHPVIRKESRQQGKTLRAHYAHMVVHGVLHLRGRDHVKRTEAERMEREEIRILARLGFANPYTIE